MRSPFLSFILLAATLAPALAAPTPAGSTALVARKHHSFGNGGDATGGDGGIAVDGNANGGDAQAGNGGDGDFFGGDGGDARGGDGGIAIGGKW